MGMRNELYVSNRKEWRVWLEQNHSHMQEIWLIYYKKHSGKPRIPYDDAVEEALCFGWIDSIVKKIDDERYCQKFTPRKDRSNWSELNKKRVKKMIRQGLMTEAGMAKIRAARESGEWDKIPSQRDFPDIPNEFKKELDRNKMAKDNFDNLAPSYRRQFVGWIAAAKRSETRQSRIKEAVGLL
jgi:uncharacterized protein YdeI (YjbR/CyaY-like superfamily)